MGTLIQFGGGDRFIVVSQTVEEVETAVKAAIQSGTPLLHFTRERDGEDLIVNPAQVSVIQKAA
jgi:hypothetical protein